METIRETLRDLTDFVAAEAALATLSKKLEQYHALSATARELITNGAGFLWVNEDGRELLAIRREDEIIEWVHEVCAALRPFARDGDAA